MHAASNAEIRYVDASLRFDALQRAMKFIFGRKSSANALKNTEVGVLEHVFARDRSFARFLGIPGTELPVSTNFAGRQRIVE